MQQAICEYLSYLRFSSSDGVAVPTTLRSLLHQDLNNACTEIRNRIADRQLPLQTAVTAVHIIGMVGKISYQIQLKSTGPILGVMSRINTVVAACGFRAYDLPTFGTTDEDIRLELDDIMEILMRLMPGSGNPPVLIWAGRGV